MLPGFMQQVTQQRSFYATDFSDYAAASDLSGNGWTRRAAANPNNMSCTVGANTVTLSGKRVTITHTGGAQVYTTTWNQVPNTTTDFEVLSLITWGSPSTNGGSGVIGRADSTGANAYNAVQHGTFTTLNGCFETAEIIGGTDNFLAQSTVVPTPGLRYWSRFRISSTLVEGRCWQYGTAEPATWSCSANDATDTAGYIGLMVVDSSPSWFCEWFSVAFGAATAPAQSG